MLTKIVVKFITGKRSSAHTMTLVNTITGERQVYEYDDHNDLYNDASHVYNDALNNGYAAYVESDICAYFWQYDNDGNIEIVQMILNSEEK